MKYCDKTWYVGNCALKYCPCVLLLLMMRMLNTSFAYSDWLITTKSNIQSSIWVNMTKLGMWVVAHSSIIHVFCC